MTPFSANVIVDIIIAKWSDTLEPYKEEDLRNIPGLYDYVFCHHNYIIAAKQVLETEFSSYPVFSKSKRIQKVKMIEAAKTLLTATPLTIDEKVSALGSLRERPSPGRVVYWPNVDGVSVPMDPLGFFESIAHNWR